MSLQRIGTYGALLSSPDRDSGVTGSWQWAVGGLLTVDAFRPDRYARLHLPPADLDTPIGQQVRDLHGAGPVRPEEVRLPTAWVRSALVDAVDRWFDVPLEEGLLLADRALAAAEVGAADEAARLYGTARPALLELTVRMGGRRSNAGAQIAELDRILAAAPPGYGVIRPRFDRPPTGGDYLAALGQEEEERHRSGRTSARTRGKGEGGLAGRDDGDVAVLLDPLHLAARLLAGPGTARVVGDRVEIECEAAQGVTAQVAAAGRLIAQLVDPGAETRAGTEGVLRLAPLRLDGRTFRGSLPLPRAAAGLVVTVRDGSVQAPPRTGPGGLAQVAALRALRDAFAAERLAAGFEVLDDASGAVLEEQRRSTYLHEAGSHLLGVGETLPEWLDPWTPVAVDPAYHDSARPLLAELTRAIAHP